MRLTAATIDGLKLDTGVADKIVFDADVPGFGIRMPRQRGAYVGLPVQDWRKDQAPRSWSGVRDYAREGPRDCCGASCQGASGW